MSVHLEMARQLSANLSVDTPALQQLSRQESLERKQAMPASQTVGQLSEAGLWQGQITISNLASVSLLCVLPCNHHLYKMPAATADCMAAHQAVLLTQGSSDACTP